MECPTVAQSETYKALSLLTDYRLSPIGVEDILTQYWFEKGRPRGILFPNKFTGNYLTVSTLEQVMRRAVSDAELPKKATPHCLRHSFATHLMEQGVERQNIQALLGHRDPKSTEVYLHVSNKSLMGIQSPFDRKEGADYE